MEGEHGGSTLEGERHQGGGRDGDQDANADDLALLGIEGGCKSTMIVPITIHT